VVIHPRLSVNDASTIQWTLEQDVELFGELGVKDVSLLLRKIEVAGIERSAKLIADAGLRVDNITVGPCFELARPEQWPAGRDRLRDCLRAAERVGTRSIVITTGPAADLTWEDAADALETALLPVLEEARRDGFEIAFEHTNGLRFDISFVHNLRDGVDLARRLGIGLCMEVNNIWGERGLAETITRGVDLLRMVQVNDFVVGTFSTPDRAVPGDGDIPLRRILGQLVAAGYRRFFELEIVGPRIEAEGYASAVRRSLVYLTTLLGELGA
jgi:sugar phosphate isomerase/epimerase